MNVLTSPLFTVRQGETYKKVSFKDIISGEAKGFAFSEGTALKSLSQLLLGCHLIQVLMNGDRYSRELLLNRIAAQAENYNLLGTGHRFLQLPFGVEEVGNKDTPKKVFTFLNPEATGGPFGHRYGEEAYCPACVAKDLFLFQLTVPGAGKGAGGPWGAGLFTFYNEGGDALHTLESNVPKIDSALAQDDHRNMPHVRCRRIDPPWVRPEFQDLLRGGSVAEITNPIFDQTVFDLWMTRQVWLQTQTLVKAATCLSCGEETLITITGLQEGRGKGEGNFTKGAETKTFGELKLVVSLEDPTTPGKIPTLYSPWIYAKGKKTKKQYVAIQNLPGTQLSDLLTASKDFLSGEKAAAIFRTGARVETRNVDGDRSRTIQIFCLLGAENPGCYGGTVEHHIPLGSDQTGLADVLSDLHGALEEVQGRMEGCLKGTFGEKEAKNQATPITVAKENLQHAANCFQNFISYNDLGVAVGDKDKFRFSLQLEANKQYLQATWNWAQGSPARLSRVAKNYPYYKEKPVSKETPFLEAFNNYLPQKDNRGVNAQLRQINFPSPQESPEKYLPAFDNRIYSYACDSRLRDMQLCLISLFPHGLSHAERVPFGKGLRRALGAEARDTDLERAARLSEYKDMREFCYHLAIFVKRQGGLKVDLNQLYWDARKIFLQEDRSPAVDWCLEIYRDEKACQR